MVRYGKRKYKKRKYTVSRSKLANKRIDTLFEKRCLEITKKQIKKSHEWYTVKILTKDPQFDWVTHGSWLRVPSASCFSLNAGTMFHLRLSDLGQILENSIFSASANDALTNDLIISSFRNKFDIRYNGASDCRVDMSIVKVNGSQLLSQQTNVPTIEMIEPLNDLYEYWPSTVRQSLDFKFSRVAHKRITLRPAHLYTDNRIVSNVGSNQGYAFTSALSIHTDPQKSVTLNKYFKGQGAKLFVQNALRAPQTEYYLMVAADRPIEFTCVTAIKFRLDKAADISQPGNE